MGDAYHDGITVEEVNSFLGKGKYVDLQSGKYVDKDKYDKAVNDKTAVQKSLDDLTEKTKDYDTIKGENDKFKSDKADADLKAKLVGYGISDKAFKYVKGDIADKSLTIGDDDKANKDAVTAYLKDHPQFASTTPNPTARKVVSTIINAGEKTKDDTSHESINNRFREAAGRKVNVGNDD